MVKHTQTIPRQIADELFECVRPFCGIGTKSVNCVHISITCDFNVFIHMKFIILNMKFLYCIQNIQNLNGRIEGSKTKMKSHSK